MFDTVGKSSVTDAAHTAGGGQPGTELGVGKRSLVEQTFGAAPRAEKRQLGGDGGDGDDRGEKRWRGDGAGGQGGGEGGGAGGAGGGLAGDDFPYEIEPGVGSFAHDQSPAVENAVLAPPPPPTLAPGPAYVGNIITVSRGKDKSPVAVAAQYGAEAFDDPRQASERFALVVGVNRMESVTEPADSQAAPVDAELAQVPQFRQFPLAAFRRLWRPVWRHTGGPNAGQAASFDEVRAAATRHQGAARAEEAAGNQLPPVGPMRTATTQHPATQRYTQSLQQRFASVFVHVGDADAVNLKAEATADAQAPTGLFDRYDEVIGEAHSAGRNPMLVSGGYRFRVDNRYLAPAQQHADPHAGQAGRVAPQTAESADLDMQVRQGLASVDPSRVYLPEPNLLIRADAAGHANFGPENKHESRRLAESLNGGLAPDRAWGTQNILFDTRAALYTDGGRFDREMTHNFGRTQGLNGDDYAAGATDVEGLFHPKRNPQSIARKRELGNAIANMNGNIGDILDVFLPQQLMKLSAQRTEGGEQRSTLDTVRAYLDTYATIAGGLERAILEVSSDEEIDIPPKTKTAMSRAKRQRAAEAVRPSVAEHEAFSTAGLGRPEALSEQLVTAISAAKRFDGANLPEILALCRAAAVATARFLSTFYPQAAPPPQLAAAPAVQPPAAAASSSSLPGPMDVDGDAAQPGTL